MDTLRFLLAIVLTIAVVVLTNVLFPPQPPPREPAAPEEAQAEAEPPVAPPETTVADTPETPPAEEPADADAAVAALAREEPGPAADTIYVESSLYRYGFTTRGAGLVWAELLPFESLTRPGAVQLVAEDQGPLIRYGLEVGDQTIDLSELPFRPLPSAENLRIEEGRPDTLRFVYAVPGEDFGIEIRYGFHPDRYVVDVDARVVGSTQRMRLLVGIGPTLAVNEAEPEEDRRALAYVVNDTEEGIESVALNDVEGERIEDGPLLWAAMKNKYFLAAALRDPEAGGSEYFGGVIAEDVPGEHTAQVNATLTFGRDGRVGYDLYVGPQDPARLGELGEGIEDVNPYGWRILQPVIRPLGHFITWALIGLHNVLGIGYGWVLILFGFLVQLVLWPLNTKAMRSQIKNMELQPVLKEIQTKYKDNPERLQKEMVRLYKEEGFNPLGGCLPMLIPFPVLITLFFVFQNTIEFRGVEFLWLPDLSRPDPLYLLPILLGLSMFVTQWISMRSTAQQNPQMKIMMWFMPAFMVIIFFNLASGLNLYYAASNVAAIPRQALIMKERKRAQARVKSES